MGSIRARTNISIGEHSDILVNIVTFNGLTDEKEHIALIFKQGDKQSAPLVRLHSECLTGDVFNSSRCDCGEQLDETVKLMNSHGGILLYLRQEGRGIGLYNKIDAYVLQRQGMNTYEANKHLGFGEDERDFSVAEEMLIALGVDNIELITNNPKKINAMKAGQVNVRRVVKTGIYRKTDNTNYLAAKKNHGNHNLVS